MCATYLARAGKRVLLLEAADRLGGAATTREFAPGFKVSACAHLLHLMPAALMRELRLAEHGLKLAAEALPTVALARSAPHLQLGSGDVSGLAQTQSRRRRGHAGLAGPTAAFRARIASGDDADAAAPGH